MLPPPGLQRCQYIYKQRWKTTWKHAYICIATTFQMQSVTKNLTSMDHIHIFMVMSHETAMTRRGQGAVAFYHRLMKSLVYHRLMKSLVCPLLLMKNNQNWKGGGTSVFICNLHLFTKQATLLIWYLIISWQHNIVSLLLVMVQLTTSSYGTAQQRVVGNNASDSLVWI